MFVFNILHDLSTKLLFFFFYVSKKTLFLLLLLCVRSHKKQAISKHSTLLYIFSYCTEILCGIVDHKSTMVPSVHISCGAWKVVYWFCLLLRFFSVVERTQKNFFSHKNHRKFSLFTAAESSQWIAICLAINYQFRSLQSFCCWLFGIASDFFTHMQLCGSLLFDWRKWTEKNWIPLKKRFCCLFSGLVPEQKIKRAPTQATYEHGSRTFLWRIEKNARISHELITGRAWRARLSLFCQRQVWFWIRRTTVPPTWLTILSWTSRDAFQCTRYVVEIEFFMIEGRLQLTGRFHLGGPMDHPGAMPGMVNEFGMTPDASFLNQPNGPPITGGANPSERSGSPEFMSSAGNFSESSNINEGLVW